jgi:hypothetical protein
MYADSEAARVHQSGSPLVVPADPSSPAALPFARLNLRRNPFGEWDLSSWAALAVVEVARFVPRLRQPGYAVQFMGDKGRGKTTHMLAIQRYFPGAAYVHLGEKRGQDSLWSVRRLSASYAWKTTRSPPFFHRIPHGHPLLIDEVQRLPPRARCRVFRRPVSLVLGTHEDFDSELRGAGFDVQTVHVGGSLHARRLGQILNRRVEAARRGPGRLPQVTIETARAMIDRFGDDLRAIQWHMYDLFQNLPGIQDV